VTYDRRGLSRSTPVRTEKYEIATHADDAAQLIAALSAGPAFVFGSSMGALIGLELAARHPDRVRLLIAHEPPVYALLEGAERAEALWGHTETIEAFRREGLPAAMKLMIARAGVDFNDREPEVPSPVAAATEPKTAAQRIPDLQHFLTRDAPAVSRYQPDIAALQAAASKIVPALSSNSPSTFRAF
jgi:pimeloyl-ACP methyl ester carboxylesterase